MEYIEAIKLTKKINKYLSCFSYRTKKKLYEEIEYKNKIETKIKYVKYINIGINELIKNNYKFNEIRKKINNYQGKQKRIRNRIKKMDTNNIWFATYTIKDKYMKKNHSRKLKEINQGKNYIINSDYGDKTNRLHYHGIIESKEEPIKWEYGFCKFIKIKNNNIEALAKYIDKLTNHTIKETTKKIIYSRVRV